MAWSVQSAGDNTGDVLVTHNGTTVRYTAAEFWCFAEGVKDGEFDDMIDLTDRT